MSLFISSSRALNIDIPLMPIQQKGNVLLNRALNPAAAHILPVRASSATLSLFIHRELGTPFQSTRAYIERKFGQHLSEMKQSTDAESSQGGAIEEIELTALRGAEREVKGG